MSQTNVTQYLTFVVYLSNVVLNCNEPNTFLKHIILLQQNVVIQFTFVVYLTNVV
jgi:hypothetical protein